MRALCCHQGCGHYLLQSVMSRAMVLLQLGSVVMIMTCVSMEGDCNHALLRWQSHPLIALRLLILSFAGYCELVLPIRKEHTPTLRKDVPAPHHRHTFHLGSTLVLILLSRMWVSQP